MQRTQFHIKEISVQYEGNVKHATGERQSRFIQKKERKKKPWLLNLKREDASHPKFIRS
jgi:hypothetical protein